jgi:hypothetical protein
LILVLYNHLKPCTELKLTQTFNDSEDGISISALTNDDFARSTGSSVVGIDGSAAISSVAAIIASMEWPRRKYNRICAVESLEMCIYII